MCRSTAWVVAAALTAASSHSLASAPVDVAYRYDLADFTGTIPYSDARVVADPARSEVYTVFGNEIRVFNDAGMEIYSFDVDHEMGRVVDVAIEASGDLLMLVYASGAGEGSSVWTLVRADFRGRPTGELAVSRSGGAEDLLPARLFLRAGRIWLLSPMQMRAAVYRPDGALERVLDLAELAGLPDEDRGNAEVSGFDVGGDGTVVFAIPVQFRVHAIAPDGSARSFGRTGSAAGNFGVLGDLALDADGNIFVSDRLRGIVIVFASDFRFLREFGRAAGREWLARPGALALDPGGRLYVSQARNRGIAVYAIASAP